MGGGENALLMTADSYLPPDAEVEPATVGPAEPDADVEVHLGAVQGR